MLDSTLFSASKCTNFLKSVGMKTGKEKILELERIAELSYLFFFVPIFSFNIKDKFQYPRKIYPGDTGFIHSVSKEKRMGKIYESVVFLSLRRNLKPDEEIGYWKDQSNFEVDFVTRKGLEVKNIIQVSLGQEIKEREFRAGLRAAKEFNKDEVLIIGDIEGVEQKNGITFRLIPLRHWLP
jgi:predicted AAA+ superfamily ATPase